VCTAGTVSLHNVRHFGSLQELRFSFTDGVTISGLFKRLRFGIQKLAGCETGVWIVTAVFVNEV